MNKQERDRLRKLIADAQTILASSWSIEGKDIFFDVLPALLDHIDALEGLVESAFREGYRYGWSDGVDDGNFTRSRSEDVCWDDSDTKAALTKAEETRNG
jgi:hypothetical protein